VRRNHPGPLPGGVPAVPHRGAAGRAQPVNLGDQPDDQRYGADQQAGVGRVFHVRRHHGRVGADLAGLDDLRVVGLRSVFSSPDTPSMIWTWPPNAELRGIAWRTEPGGLEPVGAVGCRYRNFFLGLISSLWSAGLWTVSRHGWDVS